MEFIDAQHFKYEMFKFLKSRGVLFTVQDPRHPLKAVNRNTFGLRLSEGALNVPGVPRFTEDDTDQYMYQSLTEANDRIEAFIATQMALPAERRKFPFECLFIVHGHAIALSENAASSGRRPNGVWARYPTIQANIEAWRAARGDVTRAMEAIRNARVTVDPRVSIENIERADWYNYDTAVKRWSSDTTFFANTDQIDNFLTELSGRYDHWYRVQLFMCFYKDHENAVQEAERRLEAERQAERQRLAEIARQQAQEREQAAAIESLSRIQTRLERFSQFAPKRAQMEKSAQDHLSKFLLGMDAGGIQIVESDSTDLTPTVSMEYTNGVECEVVANNHGIFVKNLVVPQNMMKHFVELLKTVKG